MKFLVLPLIALSLFAQTAEEKRLKESAEVLREVMGIKDKAIPQDLLDKAECAVIVPGMKKGAFIAGAKFGKGFMTCRQEDKVGWKSPAAVRIEGGSFGFQIGGSETDVIMLVMNKRGAEKLLASKFTLGGDASVAAGPVGRSSSAKTDAKMQAEILSYSRSRGVFAGIALDGATLRPDHDANAEMYGGHKLTNKQILRGSTKPTTGGTELAANLNRYSSTKE